MCQEPATIVVVDDDPAIVSMLSDFFEMLGLVTVICPVASQTSTCIAQHRPTVVILDVLFDGSLTGIDLLLQLRADPSTRAVPIVFFTGSDRQLQKLLPDYPAHGATFVRKPDIEQLITCVQDLVHQAP